MGNEHTALKTKIETWYPVVKGIFINIININIKHKQWPQIGNNWSQKQFIYDMKVSEAVGAKYGFTKIEEKINCTKIVQNKLR